MTKIINWGFIGLGNASLNLAKEFKKISNARLLSVASHTKEKRDFFKRKYKGEYVYNILQEEHSDMYVNNMLCETLDPRNSIRNLYTNKSSSKNIIEYNKTMKKYF